MTITSTDYQGQPTGKSRTWWLAGLIAEEVAAGALNLSQIVTSTPTTPVTTTPVTTTPVTTTPVTTTPVTTTPTPTPTPTPVTPTPSPTSFTGTITPTALAASALLLNPGCGVDSWLGQAPVGPIPSGWPLDIYIRPDGAWKTVETSKGVYNWASIDAQLAALPKGARATLRIMPWYNTGSPAEAPSYVPTEAAGNPAWNNTAYIQAWCNLVTAAGAKYDLDPRVWAWDVSGYGAWGEGGSITGSSTITTANMTAIIQNAAKAFPNTWIIGPGEDPGWSLMPTVLGVGKGKWGLRMDDLGGDVMGTGQALTYSGTANANAWQFGPMLTEWASGTIVLGKSMVESLHISALSCGNAAWMPSYSTASASDKAALLALINEAGYRYSLDKLVITSTSITTTWTNHGVAPTYDAWNVQLLANGQPVTLVDDLRKVLPGSTSYTTTVALPAGTPITFRVVDPTGYLAPMQLAIAGRQADGSYLLAS